MDVTEAIATRRMVAQVDKERRIARDEVEALVNAAVRAPNHHLTQPWRFVVLTGEALDGLGEAMADRVREQYAGQPELEQKVELEKSRPLRAPVILVVVYVPSANPKAIGVEDRYAMGAAMENILLTAHGMGLGAYLRTGRGAEYLGVHRFLGLSEGEEIAGFIYLGYPAEAQERPPTNRDEPRVTWVGWD